MSERIITSGSIKEVIVDAIGEIFCQPQAETLELLKQAWGREEDEIARDMLEAMLKNTELAAAEGVPLCQDTGLVIVFAELGADVRIAGGCLRDIIERGAAEAWSKFYLRDSIAMDPLRGRTGIPLPGKPSDRIPVILHIDHAEGDRITLHIALKGGGAENCSVLKMFDPTASLDEIEDFISDTVVNAGGKPCPPVTVGVGIGGDFEYCAVLAKKALLLPESSMSEEKGIIEMESRLLDKINARGMGVQGFAGRTTALEVSILTAPCHIASLPVAVNIDCHAHRCATRII
jgi:fumarate hydratase subunit alpha